MSMLDIYDHDYNHIGIEDSKRVHELGLWHRVFTCQIFDPQKKTAFFQRKHPARYSFHSEDYIDISVGGHYEAGETIEDGVRELYEETNIHVAFSRLIPIGVRRLSAKPADNYFINEFQHIFLLPFRGSLADLVKENNETSSYTQINIYDMIDLLLLAKDKIDGISCYEINGTKTTQDVYLSRNDIAPYYMRTDQFLLRLMVAAKRYIEKQYDEGLLFW